MRLRGARSLLNEPLKKQSSWNLRPSPHWFSDGNVWSLCCSVLGSVFSFYLLSSGVAENAAVWLSCSTWALQLAALCAPLHLSPKALQSTLKMSVEQASLRWSDSGPVSLSSSSLSQARFAWEFCKHCFSFDLQCVKHETCEVSGAAQIISGSRAISCGNERFVTAQVLAWVTLCTYRWGC